MRKSLFEGPEVAKNPVFGKLLLRTQFYKTHRNAEHELFIFTILLILVNIYKFHFKNYIFE